MNRPTPETDSYANRDWWTLFRANEHARELERQRDEALKNLDEEMKFHHRTHSELVKANCKILDLQMQLDHLTPQTQTKKNQ